MVAGTDTIVEKLTVQRSAALRARESSVEQLCNSILLAEKSPRGGAEGRWQVARILHGYSTHSASVTVHYLDFARSMIANLRKLL